MVERCALYMFHIRRSLLAALRSLYGDIMSESCVYVCVVLRQLGDENSLEKKNQHDFDRARFSAAAVSDLV